MNIIRIPTLLRFNTSVDVTSEINFQSQFMEFACANDHRVIVNSKGMVQWSVIEICVGVVVACMPHARQLAGSLGCHTSTGEKGKNSSGTKPIFPERSIRTIAMTPLIEESRQYDQTHSN